MEQKGFYLNSARRQSLFLSFTGIDYDKDDQAEGKLDRFTRWVQSVVAQFEGSVLQLTMGDKGSLSVCSIWCTYCSQR